MSNVIEITHLSKRYQISDSLPYFTLRDNLTKSLTHPLRLFRHEKRPNFWALKDISFSVKEGEVLGILGNNGAGKSTFLKILSRITPPTEGEITLRGRLGSLLEVGTGFHPELTGRENIFLNGAILGMSKKEVQRQFDAIVAFAEVEKFLDTPMKHYSSGMYTRLAFSVAAHLESEIILVDEVLAVGDIEFQKKCLGKMGDIAKQGRTILFVSHNMGAVQQLCTRCVVLEKGKCVFVGNTDSAIGKYLERGRLTAATGNLRERARDSNVTLKAKLHKISINPGSRSTTISSTKPIHIELEFVAKETLRTGFYISIKDENKRSVVLLSSGIRGQDVTIKKGKHVVSCDLEPTRLASGTYSIDCGLMYPNREIVDFVSDALFFSITGSDPYHSGFDYNQQLGIFYVAHEWTMHDF